MKRRRLLLLSVLIVALLFGGCGLWVWQAKRQYALNRQLIDALVHGDSKQALALVNAGADPNTRFTPSPAPTLTLLFDQLLRHSSPSVPDSPTALMIVCGRSIPQNSKRQNGRFGREFRMAPLLNENVPLVEAMLSRGGNVHTMSSGSDALNCAVGANRLQTAELLLQNGANPNTPSNSANFNRTPLMYAALEDDADITHCLLAHGANPNAQDSNGRARLWYALESPFEHSTNKKMFLIVSELLVCGGNPNAADKDGCTLLQIAQALQRPDIVALLRKGAK